MGKLDRRLLREHEERILRGLASFYYEAGHTSEAYRDDDTGGVYEHKLAHRLGYKLAPGDRSPGELRHVGRLKLKAWSVG
jgi:hypothetical protein